ncbi:AI-2E family transporter [Clostridium sp. BJN0001]|uniref:AI-2E family transporter n=1 Tax=Clostridium sp. BJN0001 TaxID=2930219 RepID=UPI001FD55BDF|nr:AI-2E family transporter [Clostridium sp. BJN0001]
MKLDIDKKLLKFCIYVVCTAITIYFSFAILQNTRNIFDFIIDNTVKVYSMVKPLIFAIIISYLMFPIMNFIENFLSTNKIYAIKSKSRCRFIGIITSYVFILSIIVSLFLGIYYMVGGQISKNTTITKMINEVITYVQTNSFSTFSVKATLESLNVPFANTIEPYIVDALTGFQNYLVGNLNNFTDYLMSIGSGIITLFISIILSIYILNDYEYFINLWEKIYFLIFRNSIVGKRIIYVFKIMDTNFGKFIKGQLLEALCVGILSGIALYIVGIDYAFVIGMIGGLCNIIPYLGPLIGTILAAIIGLLSGHPIKILYAVLAMQVVQQIDNNLLAPKIVGDSVGLHPVFTLIVILIGGNIGGLLGMLLAVPLAASFKVIFNNWYDSYSKKIKEKE